MLERILDIAMGSQRSVQLKGLRLVPEGATAGAVSIVVDGSRITQVVPAETEIAGPAIDCTGLWALPGLFNSHTHLMADERDASRPRHPYPRGKAALLLDSVVRAREALRAGVTTIRDCNAPAFGVLQLRDAIAGGDLEGSRMFVAGSAICITGGHMHSMSVEADGPEAVTAAVRGQIKRGVDFIKIVVQASSGRGAFTTPGTQMTSEEIAAAVETAHSLGKKVTAHAITDFGIQKALDAGVDCIEHGYGTTSDQLAEMKERGTWLVPTLSVHGAMIRAGESAGFGEDKLSQSRRILEMGQAMAMDAYAQGVNVAFGTDAGSPHNPVWDIVTEFQLLAEAGIEPARILDAATIGSAALLGVDGDLGSIETGKLADIVLVAGDPRLDPTVLARPTMVIKEGRIVIDRTTQDPGRGVWEQDVLER